ncbi:MAG TPA: 4-amino-4-deoxy-L-arabinose transferase, partial [Isosphaeraceae bacterium]
MNPSSWRDRTWLALMMAGFLAWHGPLMARVAPGQDEDFYAVPGITVLRSGVPRIPYIPSRDPRTIYYRADVALYTLPPLGFYLQAPVVAALGAGIAPARLASALAGLLAAYLVYALGRA